MTQAIRMGGREVSRVGIVDDDARVRGSYWYTITDANLAPVEYDSGLPPQPIQAVERFLEECEAALCDNRLTPSGYARYNGTDLVVECYKQKFPAVLCTSYETNAEELRPYLPWMPVRLTETELNPDSLRQAIETCLTELIAGPPSHREPWRTLVHVEQVEVHHCFVVVPAWDTHQKVRLRRADLPPAMNDHLQSDWRCYAEVNLGAESLDDLYFIAWESP